MSNTGSKMTTDIIVGKAEVGLDIMVLQQTRQEIEINLPLEVMQIAILYNNRRFNKKMMMMMMIILTKIQNKIERLNIMTRKNTIMEIIKTTKLRQLKMINSKIMISRMIQLSYNNGI